MGGDEVLVGEGKILLRDKKIYLVVEFSLLRDADFYVLTQASKMPSCRQERPSEITFEPVIDDYLRSRNTHLRKPHKPSRTT